MVAGLVSGRVSPPAGVLGASALLYVIGITTASQAFSGFSNPAPITVAGLYVVAGAVDRTGAIEPLVSKLLAAPGRVRADLARLVLPAAAGSAFLANTPIVAMLTPAVTRWSDEHHKSASTFLIPLSYATILGGAATAIGTSTNLVASGLLVEAGEEPLSLFELAPVALPLALVGLIVIIFLAPIVLPERRRPRTPEVGRPFTVAMLVEPDGWIDGQTVEEAGLRHLRGVYLVEIVRGDDGVIIAPVGPRQHLRGGDRLIFAGQVDDIVDLQGTAGLVSAEAGASDALADPTKTGFFEVVIGPSSPLAGRTAADLGFRKRYGGAILAIHRSGRPVDSKLGAVLFRAGDTLLVVAERGFRVRWKDTGEFLLVSRLDAAMPTSTSRSWWALGALAAIVVLPLLGWLSVGRATTLAAIVVVAAGVLRPREARDAVDVNVVLMIGGAFGLGEAAARSGLAGFVAEQLLSVFGWAGAIGAAVGIILITMALTELITNAAAVVLVFPIVIDVADQASLDPRVLLIGAAVAGSASFLTPIGYQTNMMVYGPGGYRFTDYLRLGIPMSLLTIAMVSSLVVVLS
ncbi:MAG: di/tricarboxylate transporter [Verrucomicrobiales bacterium]|jgi:di/tricarboxylate transporter